MNEHNAPADRLDLVTVVRDAGVALSPLAEAEHMTLEIAAHEPLPVAGARDELTQVFQNLLHNAIKYGREGTAVRVRFGREDNGMVFASVSDAGEGIAREAIPRLTERFYRVDVPRTRERAGTGLGLAIVKHIINRHRGRLHVESTPGTGSTFTVLLPLLPEPG
jgi:two-component system phosphate regulon sensor histidine kinase PhoR